MMGVDPEDFARQMDYVSRLSKLVAPRAFSFLEDTILFTGNHPFSSEELAGLLPTQVECYEDYEAPREARFSVVIVGQTDFSKDLIRSVVDRSSLPPSFLPQEGFLDELLFGHDWWGTDIEWLNAVLQYHPGLQYVKSLETFPWPGTEVEVSQGGGDGELELRERSRLKELGYDTGKSRTVRWRVLTDKAIPELGLPKVAGMIAWFCRLKKRQRGGKQKFARAIGEWEHDLTRLEREIYPKHPRFNWPRSEP